MFFDSDGSAGLFSLISCCYGLCVLFVLCRCLSVLTQTLKRRRILAHRLEPCIAEADAKKSWSLAFQVGTQGRKKQNRGLGNIFIVFWHCLLGLSFLACSVML